MKKALRILCLLMGLQAIVLVVIEILAYYFDSSLLLPVAAAIPLFLAADFLLFKTICKNIRLSRIERNLAEAKEQGQLEKNYEESQARWRTESDRAKHYLLVRLQTVSDMIGAINGEVQQGEEKPDQVGVRRLLKEIEETVDRTRERHFCQHLISNVILCEKVKEAQEKGISVEVRTAVPDFIQLPEYEWCSIWCNLLDNAIEASEKLLEEKRWMSVRAAIQNGYFYITIENATVGGISLHSTDKQDHENHGFGLLILKELAIKHGGDLVLEQRKDIHLSIFTIAVLERSEG